MDGLTKPQRPDRSKVNLNDPVELKHWLKALRVNRAELEKAINKVGNSVAAVRKELEHRK